MRGRKSRVAEGHLHPRSGRVAQGDKASVGRTDMEEIAADSAKWSREETEDSASEDETENAGGAEI